MEKNDKLYISVIVSLMLFIGACKESNTGRNSSIDSYSKIDTVALNKRFSILTELDLKMKSMECPGASIFVVYDGKPLLHYQYGLRNRDSISLKIDSATLFRIGSLSKGFAGILASKLIKQGLIDLNAPVVKYIPEFKLRAKQKGDSIRVWHILSHTTGLTEHAFSNLIDEKRDKATLLTSINRIMVRDSTGRRYAYQNAVFSLIEEIVQSVTGLSYQEAVQKYLFDPLDMKHSSVSYEGIMAQENKAFPHRWNGPANGYIRADFHQAYYNTPSAGGINSNAIDMGKWLLALLKDNHKIIDDTTKEIAFSPRINTSWDDKYYNAWDMADNSFYCFGWRQIRLNDNIIHFHGGQVNNFRCEIAFHREKKYGMVALFNAHCDLANIITPMMVQVLGE